MAADEKEAGLRSTLNWGHTVSHATSTLTLTLTLTLTIILTLTQVGHAIEALKSPALMHGELGLGSGLGLGLGLGRG